MPGFYSLTKEKRAQLVDEIHKNIFLSIQKNTNVKIIDYFSDEDTYIRKSAYLSMGRIYFQNKNLQSKIISLLKKILKEKDSKIRQTVINAAGEIGISDFENVEYVFDAALFDEHHSVRNAVIGSVKKMGEKNPKPILKWAKKYLHHQDKEVRREICHGIELRGRKFPQDILPLLKELEFDKTTRVSKTLVHVLGQIAYKKGCLATVITHLNTWKNKSVVEEAIEEIIDVHERYKNFSVLTQAEAIKYITKYYKP